MKLDRRSSTCYSKEEQPEFLEESWLKELTKKNSELIVFFIELHAEKSKEKEVSESEKVEQDADEDGKEGDERERGEETNTLKVKEVSL